VDRLSPRHGLKIVRRLESRRRCSATERSTQLGRRASADRPGGGWHVAMGWRGRAGGERCEEFACRGIIPPARLSVSEVIKVGGASVETANLIVGIGQVADNQKAASVFSCFFSVSLSSFFSCWASPTFFFLPHSLDSILPLHWLLCYPTHSSKSHIAHATTALSADHTKRSPLIFALDVISHLPPVTPKSVLGFFCQAFSKRLMCAHFVLPLWPSWLVCVGRASSQNQSSALACTCVSTYCDCVSTSTCC